MREIKCMSNMRQWGVGFFAYANQGKGEMAWEGFGDGDTAAKPLGAWDCDWLWSNCVPMFVNDKPYYSYQQSGTIPGPDDNNIWVCPDAGPAIAGAPPATETVANGGFMMWGNQAGTPSTGGTLPPGPLVQMPVYWCYVLNSKLNDSQYSTKFAQFPDASTTAMLVEKLMRPGEINPPYSGDIGRGKTAWTRFSAGITMAATFSS